MRWTGDVHKAKDAPDTIRVLLVDDHVVVRRGISALLATEADLEVVGEAGDGREAVAKAGSLRPDVILMDLVMPEMDGIEATRHITARQREVRILVLTSFASDDKVFPAIKAGALGYLLKDSSLEELVRAIRQVHRGELSLHPIIAERVLQELPRPAGRAMAPEPLTEEEAKVLQLVAQGRSNMEIADSWGVGEAAVRVHVRNILAKLHLASRTQAVLYALREGLASLGDVSPRYVASLLAMVGKPADSISPALAEGLSATNLPGRSSSERELASLRLIAVDHEKIGQELALAGEIQASFLPEVVPDIPGWQLTARLKPARETAGDFYDFIPLPSGRLGVLVADVAGKGMGAALYMALSRTLIRTYAAEYDSRPDLVLGSVNDRILMDTRAGLFVTAFYGVLDPVSGRLTYCNAGHNPPYLLSASDGGSPQELGRTGIPLGIEWDVAWRPRGVSLAGGDVLVLYTDGITEAQDRQQEFFGEQRLREFARANLGRSARELQDVLIGQVDRFVGDAPQFDDITVMVVVRDA